MFEQCMVAVMILRYRLACIKPWH